ASVDPRDAGVTARVTSADASCVRRVYRTAVGGVVDVRPHRLAALGTSPGGRGVQIARAGTGRAPSVDPRDAGVPARVTSADASCARGAYRTAEGGIVDVRPHRLAALGTSPGGRGVQIARSGSDRAGEGGV